MLAGACRRCKGSRSSLLSCAGRSAWNLPPVGELSAPFAVCKSQPEGVQWWSKKNGSSAVPEMLLRGQLPSMLLQDQSMACVVLSASLLGQLGASHCAPCGGSSRHPVLDNVAPEQHLLGVVPASCCF